MSESLYNQPADDLWKIQEHYFYRSEHLGSPASVFMEHIYDIIKVNVSLPKGLFQPIGTLINIEIYTCEKKIAWTWEINFFLFFWLCKFVIAFKPFMMEVPIISAMKELKNLNNL